jgi:hypothetical protein
MVCSNERLEKRLLECDSRRKLLTVGPNFRLEADQVKFKLSTCDDALDYVRKIVFAASGEENSDSIFLLHAQFD